MSHAPPGEGEVASSFVSPLPMSRTAVDKLGKRLAASEHVSDEDLDLLLDVLTAYQAALDETQNRLRALGYSPTSRTKTTSVLVDKLRREHSSLKSVQDIAGTRIICNGRNEQDEIMQAVVQCFADGTRPPRVKDRRQEPSHGYRAVHVVVTVQDLPVEIQIRTERQDRWAQIVESMGDRWGRQIRYGEPPPDPDRPVFSGATATRKDLWNMVQRLAERTDAVERWQQAVMTVLRLQDDATAAGVDIEASQAVFGEEIEDVKTELAVAEVDLSRALAMFAEIAENLD